MELLNPPPINHLYLPTELEMEDVEENDEQLDSDDDQPNMDEPEYRRQMELTIGSITLWGLVEVLELVLSFHAFYKRGAPYEWTDPTLSESAIRLQIREMMTMISTRLPRTNGDKRFGDRGSESNHGPLRSNGYYLGYQMNELTTWYSMRYCYDMRH